MRFTHLRFERGCRIAGLLLIGLCALAYTAGEIGRAADMAAYESGTDRSRWSATRLRAYEAALGISVAAPVAVLRVKSVGLHVPVYPDTRELHLNRGAGLIAGMAAPAAGGNLGIAGHRDGYFRALESLKLGDEVELSASGRRFVYRVNRIDVVRKDDLALLADAPDPVVTLVTCFPFYFAGHAPQRFIAQATFERSFIADDPLTHTTGEKQP